VGCIAYYLISLLCFDMDSQFDAFDERMKKMQALYEYYKSASPQTASSISCSPVVLSFEEKRKAKAAEAAAKEKAEREAEKIKRDKAREDIERKRHALELEAAKINTVAEVKLPVEEVVEKKSHAVVYENLVCYLPGDLVLETLAYADSDWDAKLLMDACIIAGALLVPDSSIEGSMNQNRDQTSVSFVVNPMVGFDPGGTTELLFKSTITFSLEITHPEYVLLVADFGMARPSDIVSIQSLTPERYLRDLTLKIVQIYSECCGNWLVHGSRVALFSLEQSQVEIVFFTSKENNTIAE